MNRRQFLASLFVGAPAAAIAQKLGWWAALKEWWAKNPEKWTVHAEWTEHAKPQRIDELSLKYWSSFGRELSLADLRYNHTDLNRPDWLKIERPSGY